MARYERRPPDRPVGQDPPARGRPRAGRAARKAIAPFAELERTPEHIHTYRLTPLGLWNARAAGHDAEQVVDALLAYSRYAVPHALLVDVAETMARYGRLRLDKHPVHGLVLSSTDRAVFEEVLRSKKVAGMIGDRLDADSVAVHPSQRGNLKQALLKLGWPAEDFAGYVDGEAHAIELDETDWTLRDYQQEAAESFWHGGSGVVVLPCGAGKTLVGAAAMARAQATTLILVTNTVSARQWKAELIKRTTLTEEEIGEYSGARKEIRPVTIATYQVLTHAPEGRLPPPRPARRPRLGPDRLRRGAPAARPDLPDDRRPAGPPPDRPDRDPGPRGRPRGRRVQPDRPEALRRPVEGHRGQGWIAPADCVEVRVTLPEGERLAYATAEPDERYRLASCTFAKTRVAEQLVEQHPGEPTLVIGQYLDQLDELAEHLDAPGDQGRDDGQGARAALRGLPHRRDRPAGGLQGRQLLRRPARGRRGDPGLRQLRLPPGGGPAARPAAPAQGRRQRTARFYAIVSRDTVDADFAQNRQRFLAEQGYAYRIVDAADL